jgi:hypothetical protein
MINLPVGYILYGEPKIKHNTNYGYYVRPRLTDGQRIIPFYLHSDGVWRLSTAFNGEFTGYYETYEDAELVLKSAIGDNPINFNITKEQ